MTDATGRPESWDLDLLRKEHSDLLREALVLRRELQQIRKQRESEQAALLRLRSQVQSAHHREKALRQLYDAVSIENGSEVAKGAAELIWGRPRDGDSRVDPQLLERLPPESEEEDWLLPEAGLAPLLVHPGWGNYERVGETPVVLGISLLGLTEEGRARVVELVAQQQLRQRELAPVFITDHDDFRLMRDEHFVFEYLPPWPGPQVVATRGAWEDYLLRRLALIRRKWAIRRFVYFSARALTDMTGLRQDLAVAAGSEDI